jgi:hypothetical protein
MYLTIHARSTIHSIGDLLPSREAHGIKSLVALIAEFAASRLTTLPPPSAGLPPPPFFLVEVECWIGLATVEVSITSRVSASGVPRCTISISVCLIFISVGNRIGEETKLHQRFGVEAL